jgi:hypothetical protein
VTIRNKTRTKLAAELVGRALWEIGTFKDVATSRNAFREMQRNEYGRRCGGGNPESTRRSRPPPL